MSSMQEPHIRSATAEDREDIWRILKPIIRAGDVYALPSDMSHEVAMKYWFAREHSVFVAELEGRTLGTYYLRANQMGGGSHVANCGYATSTEARGKGIASAMCLDSLQRARNGGFRAMQFNFVVSTNEAAVKLWAKLGFTTVGVLPHAFAHPTLGLVDALVMFRSLMD